MILGLRLKNWRSHEVSEFIFGKGTNLLIGSIGAGKSSVLDAMCFALFGTFPALKNRRVTLEEIIMARPRRKVKAEVELKFTCNGFEYVVRREVEKGASEAWLYENGKLLESPQPQRVNEYIERLLKVDYELFSRAIYSEQNRIDYLLNIPKGVRKAQIDELLGMAKFEEARKNAAAALNKAKAARSELESYLQGVDAGELEKNSRQAREELRALAAKKNAALKELREKEGVAAQLRKSIEVLEDAARCARSLETEAEGAGASASALEVQISALNVAEIPNVEEAKALLNAAVSELSAIEKAQSELNELRVRENAVAREACLAEEELDALAGVRGAEECLNKISEIQRGIEEGRVDLKKKQQEALGLASKIARLDTEIVRARKTLEEASSAEARLKSILAEHGDLEEKTRAVEEELEVSGNELTLLKAKEKDCSAALEALSKPSAACPVCESELGESKRNALNVKRVEELDSAREKMAFVEKKMRKLFELKKNLEKVKEEARVLQAKVYESKAIAGVEENFVKEKTAASAALSRLKRETDELERAVGSLDEELAALKQELQSAHRARGLQEKLRIAREKLTSIAKEKSRLAGKFSEELLASAKKHVKEAENALQASRLKERLDALRMREAKARAELASMAFDEKALDRARKEFVALNAEVAKLNSEVEHAASFEKEKRLLLEGIEGKLAKVKDVEGKIARLDGASRKLAIFQDALVAVQFALRSQLMDCINEVLLQLWPAIYPYRDYTGVRVEASEEDYALQLQTNSAAWVPIEVASGGERSCAALALRIAFATVLTPNLSWLVLDEPTHNLDREAVLLLARALREEIPKIVEQTFIITHDEGLGEAASVKVWHVERDKERGDVTTVDELIEASA